MAIDFDIACSFRLLQFDNERENTKFLNLKRLLVGDGDGESDHGGANHTENVRTL